MDAQYPDDAAPRQHTVSTPPWPGAIAHFRGGHLVYIDPHAYEVDEALDLRCSGCTADAVVIFSMNEPGLVAFCARHKPGCRAIADMIEMAARP